MSVIEYVRLIGKEFDEVTDEVIEKWVEFVRPMVSRRQFGKLYDRAIAYLVCHNLKMSGEGDDAYSDMMGVSAMANSVGIGSISDGGSSISFNGAKSFESGILAEYAKTTYGLQYISLAKMVVIPITIQH